MSKNYELEPQLLAELVDYVVRAKIATKKFPKKAGLLPQNPLEPIVTFRQGECIVVSSGVKGRPLRKARLPPLGQPPEIFDQKIRPILVESKLIRILNQGDR